MLPGPVRRLAEEIGSDRRSGAFELAERALDVYGRLRDLDGIKGKAEELHTLLRRAQPKMAAVINASLLGRELSRRESWDGLDRLKRRLVAAKKEVARTALHLLQDAEAVVTVSYSSDVLEALRLRRKEYGELRVYVCESRPLREGVVLARDLGEAGLKAVLVADAAGPSLVADCDAVVTGADSLLRDGCLVNKVGTMSLTLACNEFGVPFYPLMEALKTEVEEGRVEWGQERRDPEELDGTVDAYNFYFEKVPARLTRLVVSDAGVARPSQHLKRFGRLEDLADFYSSGNLTADTGLSKTRGPS